MQGALGLGFGGLRFSGQGFWVLGLGVHGFRGQGLRVEVG